MKIVLAVAYVWVLAFVCLFMAICKKFAPKPKPVETKPFTHDEAWYERACYAANGKYVGVQEVEGDDRSKDLVLFNAQSGSTLALEAGRFTSQNVWHRIERHMGEWEEYAKLNV